MPVGDTVTACWKKLLCCLVLLACAPRGRAAQPWEPIDLGGLAETRSHDGVAELVLRAAPAPVTIGQVNFPGLIYNDSYAGPVLHVRPGDLVRIDFDNALTEPANLHFHGLRISPMGRADNMHVSVLPGARRSYLFRIPADHPPGLFWFHDHVHGLADRHVGAGLGGTILIDGFAGQIGGLAGVPQKLLVLKDYDAPGCTGAVLATTLHCRVISINGTDAWTDTLVSGGTQLWRIVNEGADHAMYLAAPGMQFRIVGRDGLAVLHAEDVPVIEILPAGRVDVLAVGGAPGSVALQALHVPTGNGDAFTATRQIGMVTVQQTAQPPPPVQPVLPAQPDLRDAALNARRQIVLAADAAGTHYTINGKPYAHDRIDIRVPLGTVEEWTVRNDTQDMHTFHIHQLAFQVIAINGAPQDFNGYVDIVRVPEMGEVTLLLPFTDPLIAGRFMFHCHVLKHEDAGMMANIEVYRPDAGWHAPICHAAAESTPQSAVTARMVDDAASLVQGLNN